MPPCVGEEPRPNPVLAAQQSRPPELEVDEAPALERALKASEEFLKVLSQGYNGFRPKIGGMVPTSGLAIGPEFVRRDIAQGQVLLRTSARVSYRRYSLFDAEFALPRLGGDRMFVNLLGTYRNLPQLLYFGQGPHSSQRDRTDYRLEDTSAELTAGARPLKRIRLGGTASYLRVNVGPGTLAQVPSTERAFTPATAPGLDRQGYFSIVGGFLEVDYTDLPGSPRSGGIYSARFRNYVDQRSGLPSFRRLDVDLRQYVSFFSSQRLIALRAYSTLTDASARRPVPFYLQPTLGGPDTLRGFRPFRFYDNNLVFFNAEYRWKFASSFEMAVFGDAGKVFDRRSRLNLHGLKASYGAGLRINAVQNVFMRVDLGCSHEGCQVWLRLNNSY
jgi:outer membrane protein assembly factor BamA